ncbi:hypothetical protein MRX96_058621 [Rhipicephalus microplus]
MRISLLCTEREHVRWRVTHRSRDTLPGAPEGRAEQGRASGQSRARLPASPSELRALPLLGLDFPAKSIPRTVSRNTTLGSWLAPPPSPNQHLLRTLATVSGREVRVRRRVSFRLRCCGRRGRISPGGPLVSRWPLSLLLLLGSCTPASVRGHAAAKRGQRVSVFAPSCRRGGNYGKHRRHRAHRSRATPTAPSAPLHAGGTSFFCVVTTARHANFGFARQRALSRGKHARERTLALKQTRSRRDSALGAENKILPVSGNRQEFVHAAAGPRLELGYLSE